MASQFKYKILKSNSLNLNFTFSNSKYRLEGPMDIRMMNQGYQMRYFYLNSKKISLDYFHVNFRYNFLTFFLLIYILNF